MTALVSSKLTIVSVEKTTNGNQGHTRIVPHPPVLPVTIVKVLTARTVAEDTVNSTAERNQGVHLQGDAKIIITTAGAKIGAHANGTSP